jgi:hypothetical protein
MRRSLSAAKPKLGPDATVVRRLQQADADARPGSLAMLEGLVGQLYPVVLIARLVAMEPDYQRTRRR